MGKVCARHCGIVCFGTRGCQRAKEGWTNKDGLETSLQLSQGTRYMGSGPNHADAALVQSKIPSSTPTSSFRPRWHGELRYHASLRTIGPDLERRKCMSNPRRLIYTANTPIDSGCHPRDTQERPEQCADGGLDHLGPTFPITLGTGSCRKRRRGRHGRGRGRRAP